MSSYCPFSQNYFRQPVRQQASFQPSNNVPVRPHVGPGAPKFDIKETAPGYVPPSEAQPQIPKIIYEPTDPTGKLIEPQTLETSELEILAVSGASLESCNCNCTTYGYIQLYNVTRTPIQQWLPQANASGRLYGINPVCFLAMASIESNGNASLVTNNQYGQFNGIVQIGAPLLGAYNCAINGRYSMNDLIGQGIYKTTIAGGVSLSFDILGGYLKSINNITNAFSLSATSWNGSICGTSGSFQPFGATCGAYPKPTAASCYGKAAVQLASAYANWWIDPATGKANSFYWGIFLLFQSILYPSIITFVWASKYTK